jgi:hypothetical protein
VDKSEAGVRRYSQPGMGMDMITLPQSPVFHWITAGITSVGVVDSARYHPNCTQVINS